MFVSALSKHHLRQPPPVNLRDTRIFYLHIALNKSGRLRHISPSTMDFVKNLAGGNKEGEQQQTQQQGEQKSEGGFMSKLNNLAGGGASGEKKEDGLDKGEQACPPFSATRRDTDSVDAYRCRLGPRERARPGQAGQRVGSRAGQG